MALPDVHFDIYYDGQWNDHVTDVAFESNDLTVKYGQSDEHGEAEPTEIGATLDNRGNDFSPKDPRSSLFGKIGQGTLCRVRVGDSQAEGVSIPGIEGAHVSTPDHSSLDIAGDIDIRVEVDLDTWRYQTGVPIIQKTWTATSDEFAWAFYLTTNGILRFAFSSDGTSINFKSSTEAVPQDSGRIAIRVTLDVNNGSGGHDTRFYTAPSIGGTYSQLGATTTTAGTTSIATNDLDVTIGSDASNTSLFSNTYLVPMIVHAVQIRSGINGTIVANPDFTTLTSTDIEITDSAGRLWTLSTGTGVEDRSIRGTGAIPDWKPRWDETGYAAEVEVRAAGYLEQLGHGSEKVRSSMFRDLSARENIVGYWPLEDAEGSTSFAAGRPGVDPAQAQGDFTAGSVDAIDASLPGVALNTTTVGSSGVIGTVPPYTPTARQRVFAFVSVPEGGVSALAQLLNYTCTGSIKRMSVNISTTGALTLIMRNVDGGAVLDTGPTGFNMNGEPKVISVLVTQVGSNIDWQIGAFELDGAFGLIDGTLNNQTYGRFTSASVGPSPNLNGTGYNHLTVINDDRNGDIWDIMREVLLAWTGEYALERMVRLTRENSVPFMAIGQGRDSERMGALKVDELANLLDQCGVSDMGPIGDRRDGYALLARGRADLYNQEPALTLDMRDGVVINPFNAPFDTQTVRNDVTVTRIDGSSYRAVKTAGAQSTADPPEGLGGSFPASPQLSLDTDERLPDQATWRLHLGTVDQHRVSKLEIEMEHHEDLVDEVLALRRGDIILVQNAGDLYGLPPGDLRLMFLGSTDLFTENTWHVTLNCAPGEPWTVGTISDGSDDERFDTDGSVINSASFVAGTSTSLSVSVDLGPLWTTDPGEFPLEINADGAILTVTGISGASSPQTFTVSTTVVNGVERLLTQGADVRLADPTIVAL